LIPPIPWTADPLDPPAIPNFCFYIPKTEYSRLAGVQHAADRLQGIVKYGVFVFLGFWW